MARREWKWTPHQLDKLNKIKIILEELEDYKPLTLRQIYYQLVGKGYIANNKAEYGMLSGIMKWARIDGYVSWDDVEDRNRTYHDLTGWCDSERFIGRELKGFLSGYRRDFLQTQDNYIELWIEKDALGSVFTKAALPYTVAVTVCRGFSSVSFLTDYKNRIQYHPDKNPVILYFGDLDPSGVEMLEAMETTFKDELQVSNIQFKRIALSKDDVIKYKLPHSIDALKLTDTRAKKYIEKYGEIAVELDALRPDILEQKIREAIENEIDIDLFKKEISFYRDELDKINSLKKEVEIFISERL